MVPLQSNLTAPKLLVYIRESTLWKHNLITHFVNLGHFKIKSIAGSKNDSYAVVIIILWYQGLSEGSNIKADFLTREEILAMCQWKKSTINASIFTPKKIALFLNYCCEVVKRDFGRQLIKPVIDHFHHGGCKRGVPTRIGFVKRICCSKHGKVSLIWENEWSRLNFWTHGLFKRFNTVFYKLKCESFRLWLWSG